MCPRWEFSTFKCSQNEAEQGLYTDEVSIPKKKKNFIRGYFDVSENVCVSV